MSDAVSLNEHNSSHSFGAMEIALPDQNTQPAPRGAILSDDCACWERPSLRVTAPHVSLETLPRKIELMTNEAMHGCGQHYELFHTRLGLSFKRLYRQVSEEMKEAVREAANRELGRDFLKVDHETEHRDEMDHIRSLSL